MNKTLILLLVCLAIYGGYTVYKIDKAYDWLEERAEWCYERGGTMIEAQCVKLERVDDLSSKE